MAGSKTSYLENHILDHVLGGPDYTRPATTWIALFTVSPGEAGTLTNEVTGGSYARVSVVNNSTNWPATSQLGGVGSKSNGVDFTFPTATGTWGTVVSFAIVDASTSGNCLYYGDLTVAKVISSGDTAKFAAGDLTITED